MVPAHEAVAIERFVLNSTLPIIYDHEGVAMPRGTGTLFKINDRCFVITARHLFFENGVTLNKEMFAFPENPIKGGIFTFGRYVLHLPEQEYIDIAVLEIIDETTIRRLMTGWSFLGLPQVTSPSPDGLFFVSGYPHSLVERSQGWLYGKLVTAYTTRILTVPEAAAFRERVVPGLDLFFNYGLDATTLEGKPLQTPELPGVSGASVWEYGSLEAGSIWTPERAIRVVGVQSAFVHSAYIRVKSWHAVAKALGKIDDDLAQAIERRLS